MRSLARADDAAEALDLEVSTIALEFLPYVTSLDQGTRVTASVSLVAFLDCSRGAGLHTPFGSSRTFFRPRNQEESWRGRAQEEDDDRRISRRCRD
jgi:hypothetical protein